MQAGLPAEMRLSRLREVAGRALEASLAGCTLDEFCAGFALDDQCRPLLEHVYKAAVGEMRGNVLAECDVIFKELDCGDSLARLDALVAERPELPDGTRCAHVPEGEASAMMAQATLPVKQKHRLVLRQALEQLRGENEALKQQYLAHHAQLAAAAEQVDACKVGLEQTAVQCEQWCMSAGGA